MKKIHYIISLFVLAITLGCTDDNDSVDLDSVAAPTNISVSTTVTQDNTGKVTFFPKGEGVTQYEIYFGDGTTEPAKVNPGEIVSHIYAEGVYQIKIVGIALNGKKAEVTQEVVVSFKAPENLEVVITNDLAVSKKITVTATADFALFYDVYFGEAGYPDPITANNGESVSYTYQQAGVYTIKVVAKSGGIGTTEKIQDFEAVLVTAPSTSAATPPNRQAGNVVSIYSSKYTNVAGTDFYPNWGQATGFVEFDLNGDKILNYINLNYQGIALADGITVDVSAMDFIHMDVWTADLAKLETSLISKTNGEKSVTKDLVANQWTSIDIPISAFTSQGLTVADIYQLKLVAQPTAGGTVFIDNIYFYKTPSQSIVLPLDFESSTLTYTWTGFGSADFGSIPAGVVTNPDKSGANTSNNVVKIEKLSGAQVWAGASLSLESIVDFSKGTTVKVAVWSPKVGATILYKMEDSTSPKDGNGNPTINIEVEATSTVANAWEVLSFDLTSSGTFSTSNKYDTVILFPDYNQMGTGAIYYFDDIKQFN